MTRRALIGVVVSLMVVVMAVGLWWFTPWRLFTDKVVDEALPTVATPAATPVATPPATAPASTESASASSAAGAGTAARNSVVASGGFISHEHDTSGTAEIVRLADGRLQLLLRGLDTSNGPDLRVWLTDQPVTAGTGGWRVFDDGHWVEVAKLKGNRGDQVYDLPADTDLAKARSVTIWCKRFSVSFGAAELKAPELKAP